MILQPLVAVFVLLFSTLFIVPTVTPSDTYATSTNTSPLAVETTTPEQPIQGEPSDQPPAEDTPSDAEVAKSCAEQTGAVGWIVCPSGSLLVTIIDGIYNVIITLLELRPITAEDNSPIYLVWSYMRDIANIVLVIAMIVAIISQVSGYGISNYGIKKLLPKLVIGAILLNLSYVICTVAVDLSNILGYSLGGAFDGIRDRIIMSGTMNASANVSFGDLLVPLFAGGALAIGGIAMAGGLGAALWLALPIILGGVIAVIAALITIAARQAVIYILIMIAPLAFAAYLLPNMDKWFDKWRKLFTQMLVLFPLFTVLFGASRLAAMAIIASSDHVYHVLLGVAVQLFPLFFAPSLFKMSNSVIGKVNEMARKPFGGMQRGVGDYAKGKSDTKRARNAANPSALRPSSYLTAFLERQKALAADDQQQAAEILAGKNKSYVNRKKSLSEKNKTLQSRLNSRQKTALKAMEASKEAETTGAQLKFGLEDYVINANRKAGAIPAVAELDKSHKADLDAIDNDATLTDTEKAKLKTSLVTKYEASRSKLAKGLHTALHIKSLETELTHARASDKAKELKIEMDAADYALDPANFDRLYGSERGAEQALIMAEWLKRQKGFKDHRTDMEIEIINKYNSTPEEMATNVERFLSGQADSYELRDFGKKGGPPGALKRRVTNDNPDDIEFTQALYKAYLLSEGSSPTGLIKIIAANENGAPGKAARNLVVNRKAAKGWFKDTGTISAYPFLTVPFLGAINDGKIKSEGDAFKVILENMNEITPRQWSSQSESSARLLSEIITGERNSQIVADTGIDPDTLSSLTDGALKKLITLNSTMTRENRSDMKTGTLKATIHALQYLKSDPDRFERLKKELQAEADERARLEKEYKI